MNLALKLAAKGRYSVSPNPMVGCLIVKNNQIVGQGYHRLFGGPHAEIYALEEAGEHANDATAYISLEPCCHYGKTPPCAQALIRAGIKKVFLATLDPNPLISGKGAQILKNAGIEIDVGLCHKRAKKLNEIFFHYITTQMPFVISKWAMSLDGKTQVNPFDNKQISSSKSKIHTHRIRRQVDAILIGAQTARDDNPKLTVRLSHSKTSEIKHPTRIILTGRKPLKNTLKILTNDLPNCTILVTTKKHQKNFTHLKSDQVEVLICHENESGLISLPHLLKELGKRNISSLLVEGGMQVHESFFEENLVNKIHVYIAPTIIGKSPHKIKINSLSMKKRENDFCFSGNFKEISNV